MDKDRRLRLELLGITYNQIESGVYALVFRQAGGTRRMPIVIGFAEAQAIECKLQEVKTPRPLTHDTMATTLSAFGISLVEVEIKKIGDGVFGADLILSDGTTTRVVDSRASDAVALAIRVNAPIFTSEDVLDEYGFDPDEKKRRQEKTTSATSQIRDRRVPYSGLSLDQLYAAMQKAAENEDYEEAARLKMEIENRKSK